MKNNLNQTVQKPDAIFYGWQKRPGEQPFTLYDVIAVEHPLYGSTVSENTLRKYNLRVPQIPSLR